MSSSIAIPKPKGAAVRPPETPEYGSYGSFRSQAESVASSPAGKSAVRRPSLMSASFSKAEHTVINVGNADSPRLISCVKAAQGFDWNQEIFLPSYANHEFQSLENKRDPVEEIVVTDEEVANMFPS